METAFRRLVSPRPCRSSPGPGLMALVVLLGLGAAGAMGATAAEPSFDCGQAQGTVEQLICSDDELALLDHELAEVWAAAQHELPEEELETARAYQRGWIGGRNECWKADDVGACTQDEYETRITELQVRAGLVEVPAAMTYDCGEEGEALTVVSYRDTRRPVVVLTWQDENGEQQALAFQSPDGESYEGRNVSFLEDNLEATFSRFGKAMSCQLRVACGTGRFDAEGWSLAQAGAVPEC